MDNYNVIKYKWQHGVYKITDVMKFVDRNVLNRKQFFEITGYNYDGLKRVEISENL